MAVWYVSYIIQFEMHCWLSESKCVSEFYFTDHPFLAAELYFASLLVYNHGPQCTIFINDTGTNSRLIDTFTSCFPLDLL